MSRDGSGNYTLPAGNPVVSGTPITSLWANTTLSDIGSEITNSIDRGGRTVWTANLPAGTFKITGLGAGSAAGDSVRYEQVQILGTQTVASAATCSIFASAEQSVNITGTTTVTSFGANTAGAVRFCRAISGFQITYNATSMLTPGGVDVTLSAGDWFLVKGAGSSNVEVVQVTRAAGIATRLSDLGAAAADATLSNAQYQQTWNWSWSSAGTKIGLTLGGSASAPGALTILRLFPSSALTAALQIVSPTYSGNLALFAGDGTITLGANTAQTSAGNASGVNILAPSANAGAAGDGGNISIVAGNSGTSGNSGWVSVQAGAGATGNGYAQIADDNASEYVRAAAAGVTLRATGKVVLDGKHAYLENTSGAPTIASGGGSGATIAGSDVGFEVTIGTGSPTNVVVNFANAWPTTPQIALATCSQAGAALFVTALTTSQITIDSNGVALSSGVKVRVLVLGLQ